MRTKFTNLLKPALLIVAVSSCLFIQSCEKTTDKYPKYSLESITVVPDSLKLQYRQWITATVKAASQYMTGGDYEDIDVTIRQTKLTADELFQIKLIGLRKSINDNLCDDLHLCPNELTEKEKLIFDSLMVM